LRRHTHDIRTISACVPTADVSLHCDEPPLRSVGLPHARVVHIRGCAKVSASGSGAHAARAGRLGLSREADFNTTRANGLPPGEIATDKDTLGSQRGHHQSQNASAEMAQHLQFG
jgi:hypothetical protein